MLTNLLAGLGILIIGIVVGKLLHKHSGRTNAEADVAEDDSIYRERYQLLTENIASSIIIRNKDSKIIFCSPFTEVLTGYSTQDIYQYSEDFFRAIAFEDDKHHIDRALKVAACGEAFQYRHRFYHKTGILMWAETRTVPIMDHQGEVTASLSITLDVTGSVLYQKQVEEKNRDLQDFTYMVSHDLKAPIYTIKGMHGILTQSLKELAPEDESKEAMTHIELALSRLETLVNSVIDYSKVTTQELATESVSFGDILKEVLRDLEPLTNETKTKFELENEYPKVVSNRMALYQILSNLLGNAIKYRAEERTPIIKISLEEQINNRVATFVIEDNCQGIPADKLPTIMRPFQRANSKVEGSGIGLASVKKLLDKTGGQIRVESELNKGNKFYISMRLAQ